MSRILTPLILQPLPDRKWLVVEPFSVHTDIAGPFTVPAGFITDLNSIPRLWWAISPATDYPEAGTVHDFLYARQYPRDGADTVYRELLTLLGMSPARVQSRYLALRLFGGLAYRQHAPVSSV